MAASLQNILDTDSEDELPPGWEERVTVDGKVYYANHETKVTQWIHPTTGKKKHVKGDMPYGWERCYGEDGTVFYVDHINRKTTYTDPRLAFAEEVKNSAMDFRQKFDGSSTALQILHGRDLSDKHVVVTGANSGIGFETARSLALHGATVIMACRNLSAARECQAAITKEMPKAKIEVMHLDLASLQSVKEFAATYKNTGWPLHILILNAAVFGVPWQQTEDGLELTFQVNHLAHFYLTMLLQPVLLKSAPSRVVVVSSESHRFSGLTKETVTLETLSPPANKYSDMTAYNHSKLCNILFANTLCSKLNKQGVTVLSLHPGNMMSSSIARHCNKEQLPQCIAQWPMNWRGGGLYFNNCCRCEESASAHDPDLGEALWQFSVKLLQSKVGDLSA